MVALAIDLQVRAAAVSMAREWGLSDRQREVLIWSALGHRIEEIAERLDMRPRTVRFHRTGIAEKSGLRTQLELAVAVMGRAIAEAKGGASEPDCEFGECWECGGEGFTCGCDDVMAGSCEGGQLCPDGIACPHCDASGRVLVGGEE